MNKSLSRSEAMDLINNWARESLPVKVVLFAGRPAMTLSLRGEAWPLEVGAVRVMDSVRVGVEGIAEFLISLSGGVFDLEDTTEAPEDLRKEAAGRTVRCLTCTLPSGITIYLYELWATTNIAA